MTYSFLAEFDLLRLSRTDIRQVDWTAPARRDGTIKYFKLCRTREEIIRLNVEMCRLRTAIHDEQVNMNRVIGKLKEEDVALCGEIERRWGLRRQVNQQLILRLNQIETLPGFSGQQQATGIRLGVNASAVHASDKLAADLLPATDNEGFEVEEEARQCEEESADIEKLTEYLETIND